MNPDDTIPCPPPGEDVPATDRAPAFEPEAGVCGFLGPFDLGRDELDEL